MVRSYGEKTNKFWKLGGACSYSQEFHIVTDRKFSHQHTQECSCFSLLSKQGRNKLMARSNMCVFLARLCIRSKKIPKAKLSKLGVRTRWLSFRKPLPWINVTFLPKSQPTHLLFLHLQCSPTQPKLGKEKKLWFPFSSSCSWSLF
ncbi:hypothetical protein ZOSMA_1G02430 [Zostera marina]|uniref:Uncharacterized protein n=1 Tax=Zostera marina TaxID=29655 RepID=A0A0K9PMS3_ZOSMR|nr:hypothetical protein ZOSMA_1G02430 [Zostera marina]